MSKFLALTIYIQHFNLITNTNPNKMEGYNIKTTLFWTSQTFEEYLKIPRQLSKWNNLDVSRDGSIDLSEIQENHQDFSISYVNFGTNNFFTIL